MPGKKHLPDLWCRGCGAAIHIGMYVIEAGLDRYCQGCVKKVLITHKPGPEGTSPLLRGIRRA